MENKRAYQATIIVAGATMGLGCLLPSYVNWITGVSVFNEYLTLLVQTAVAVSVFVTYGKKAAAMADTQGDGYSYSKAWGFAIMVSMVAGGVVAAGSMLLAKVLQPELEDEIVKFQYTILGMSFRSILSMTFFGGFIGLFTALVVRKYPKI